jgi:glycosyltransferase involved in cell wall biosynthesis
MNKSNPVWDYWEKQLATQNFDNEVQRNWGRVEDNYARTQEIESKLIFGRHNSEAVISIVIPAYREPILLKRTLESTFQQSFDQEYEIVVVDDSGDKKYLSELMDEICRSHKNVVYYQNERSLGANDNWNRCFLITKTDWLCLLHHDDTIFPSYLSEMYESIPFFEKNQVGIVSPASFLVSDAKKIKQSLLNRVYNRLVALRGDRPILLNLADASNSVFPNPVSILVNREKVIAVGGLNNDLGVVADSYFFALLQKSYRNALYPKVLTVSYKETGSASSNQVVARFSLRSAYWRTNAICQTLGYSTKKSLRYARRAFLYASFALLNLPAETLHQEMDDLNIPKRFLNPFYRTCYKIRKITNWFLLLFRL